MAITVDDGACRTGVQILVNSGYDLPSLFPNPAGGQLTISPGNDIYQRYCITNSIGQVFGSQPLAAAATTLDVHLYPAGLYYITFFGETGYVVSKFIKE